MRSCLVHNYMMVTNLMGVYYKYYW